MFVPSTSLIEGPAAEGLALRLAENGTSLIVVHTALDVATPGTADGFLAELGLTAESTLAPVDDAGGADIGRVARFAQAIAFEELASRVSGVVGGTVTTSAGHPDVVETIAIVPGSGGGFAADAAGLADVYISGDIGHHEANKAVALGLGLIDAGHVPSERPGVRALYAAVCESSPTATMLDDDPHPWEG
jgi:putative NIF3 family GTP cyclohydrolase 1 type 2